MKEIVWGQDKLIVKFMAEQLDSPLMSDGVGFGLRETDTGLMLAGVLFDQYNGASIAMHVAALPGARWMTRSFLHASFYYPFAQLRVNKVIGLVGSKNHRARAFDEHLGFVLEATLSDAHPDGDLLVYSMTRQQCRFLDLYKRVRNGKISSTSAA